MQKRQAMAAIKLAHEQVSKANLSVYESTMLESFDKNTGLPERTIPASMQLEQMAALRQQTQQLTDAYQLCKDNMAEIPSAGTETLLQLSHQIEYAKVLINAVNSQLAYLDNKDQVAYMSELVTKSTLKMHRVPLDEARVLSLCESRDTLLQANAIACRQALDNFKQSSRENLINVAPQENTDIFTQQIASVCDKSVKDTVEQVSDYLEMIKAQAEVARQEKASEDIIKEDSRFQNKSDSSPAFRRQVKKDLSEDAGFQKAVQILELHMAKYSGADGSKNKAEFDRQNLLEVVRSASDPASDVSAEQRYQQNTAASQQLQTQLEQLPSKLVNRADASANFKACDIALSQFKMNNVGDIKRGNYDDNPKLKEALQDNDFSAAMEIIKADPRDNEYVGLKTNLKNALEAQQNIGSRRQLFDKVKDKKDNGACVYVKENTKDASTMAENPKVQEYAYLTLRRADMSKFQEIHLGSKGKQEAVTDSASVIGADPELKQQVDAENTGALQFVMSMHGDEARAAAVRALQEEEIAAKEDLAEAKKDLIIAKAVAEVHEGEKLSEPKIEVILDRLHESNIKCSFEDVEGISSKFDQPSVSKAPDSPTSSPKTFIDRLKVVGRRRASSNADLITPKSGDGNVKRSRSNEELNRQSSEQKMETAPDVIAQCQERIANLELNSKQKTLISLSAKQDIDAGRSNPHVSDKKSMQSYIREQVLQENPGMKKINSQDVVTSVVCQQVFAETTAELSSLLAEGQYDLKQAAELVTACQAAPSSKASTTSSLLQKLGGRGNASELSDEKEKKQEQEATPAPAPEPTPPTSSKDSGPDSEPEPSSSSENDKPSTLSM